MLRGDVIKFGEHMSALSNEDRCAVDLLLEHAQYASQGPACFTQAGTGEMRERLTRVEALLNSLDALPVSDPPSDLVIKTVARCIDPVPLEASDPESQNSVPA
jgi:hypothetical protein